VSLLEVDGVTVRYGGLTAVAGVTFAVEPGEVRAIIGPNGAGKTSLFNAVTGHAPLTMGSIRFQGRRIDGLAPHEVSGRGSGARSRTGGCSAS
jgi:branched-chain amino acid transport system ATP-binding protein